MKELFVPLSLPASLTACAAPYAPQEFDFSRLDGQGVVLVTVESVAAVRIERDIHAYEAPAELGIQPEQGDRMVIRLDDRRAITRVPNGMQRFEVERTIRSTPDGRRNEQQGCTATIFDQKESL